LTATTPTAADLHKAFQVAIEDHASYVEVYGADIVEPANQDALRYLASGGAP